MKVKLALHWQMAIALLLGGLGGWLLGDYVSVWGSYIDAIGQLFMRAVNMIVLPLVFLSSALSFSSMKETKSMGRIAAKTFVYFFLTAIVAAFIGILITSVFRIGYNTPSVSSGISSIQWSSEQMEVQNRLESKTLMGYIVDVVPNNVFEAFSSGNMLSVVFFALILGLFTIQLASNHRQTINDFLSSFNELIIKIATFIIRLAPLGIFAIVMMAVGTNAERVGGLILKILLFVSAVWIALLVMGGIILPIMVATIAKVSPLKHFKQIFSSLLVAFSSCSSYGALPLILNDTKDKCGVSNSVAGFTIPLGITFNKVGTVIYECVAVVFVAQACGIPLTVVQQLSLVGLAVITVLGSPAMPMASILVLAVLLKAMNLPDEYIQLFIVVDILCDMPKTLLNAYSICCGAVIVAKSEGEKLNI